MDRLARNEEFLKKLVTSSKSRAIKLLRRATQDEYKSVFEILLNADSYLNRAELRKCKSLFICSKIKSLKKITKNQLINLFGKWFDRVIELIGRMICRLFERGLCEVYSGV